MKQSQLYFLLAGICFIQSIVSTVIHSKILLFILGVFYFFIYNQQVKIEEEQNDTS